MTDCCVLRCRQRGTEIIQLAPSPPYPILETVVCGDHKQAIDNGERWVYEEGFAPEAPSIRMGHDLPLLLTDTQLSQGHFSDQTQSILLRLDVENPDGSPDILTFEVPQRLSARLGEMLQMWSTPPPGGTDDE